MGVNNTEHTELLDANKFEQIFKDLQPRLYVYCRKYINDSEEAKDIVQECFVALWQNRNEIIYSIESYLFRAVHNRCISYIRSLRVHTDYENSARQKLREMEIHPETPKPLTELYLKEVNKLIRHCVKNLPEGCRLVFMMSRYMGMSNQEIANELGISVRTVEKHNSNALKILKEELKDYLSLIALFFSEFIIH